MGKVCGNRVFMHAKEVLGEQYGDSVCYSMDDGEDEVTVKIQKVKLAIAKRVIV